VDPKNGYLYWGDVGPDARADSMATRGPKGYDEMAQARAAGNFGWPLFRGTLPYRAYNYATGESGAPFDPEKPINDSRNNTGLRELPKLTHTYVYYPYDVTGEFPQVGTGGRNAMAGPVYYSDLYKGDKALPAYYDGKVIIYEWMRGWMKAVSLFPNGEFNKMEPFAEDIKLANLIDMEVAPDGRIYLLEYGSGWFSKNDNSGLSFIEYNGGNRPPVIDALIVDKTSGKLPLSVTAKVEARDREEDKVTYVWNLGNGETKETQEPQISHTFNDAGEYLISVEVKDDKNAIVKSEIVSVVAGNSRPEVAIELAGGNASFFMPGVPVNYKVSVTDADGTPIDDKNIFVSVDYLEGMDKVAMSLGHQEVSAAVTGKAMTLAMDCKTCHKENDKSIGPSYLEVAKKYKDTKDALTYLQGKIITGGSGVWGEVTMPAHPTITKDESRQIALYIQSLADSGSKRISLPASGTITPEPTQGANVFVLTASYTDNGENNAKPLTGVKSVALQSSTVSFSEGTKAQGFQPITFNGMNLLILPKEEGWFALPDIDLKNVKSANLVTIWQSPPKIGLDFEMRLNAVDGKLIGKGSMPIPQAGQQSGIVNVVLNSPVNEKAENIYFVFKPDTSAPAGENFVALSNVMFSNK
jgi:cytochrome c551/c552